MSLIKKRPAAMLFRRFLCLLVATVATTLAAQDLPGLKVTFTIAGKTDARTDRLLALYVPAGQAPTPFLPAGPFVVKWEGDLQSPLRGTFKLSAESSGKFKLSLNGQPLLDGPGLKTVQLNKGANRIVAELTSAAAGDTFARLSWASKDFPLEPVPPTLLTHPADKNLDGSAQRREGRLLFAQMNCAAGKDRTGVLAALILSTVGVSDEYICADYGLTKRAIERTVAWAKEHHTDMAKRWTTINPVYLAAEPQAMHVILNDLVSAHGSVINYVRSLGVSESEIQSLTALLLDQ